jgi:gliding motility-associated-like protein
VFYNENSNKSLVNIVNTSIVTLSPIPSTTDHTTFTYTLSSVEDQNGCFATSLTGTRITDVYKIPVANIPLVSDTVCGPEVKLFATKTVGAGKWYYPSAVVSYTPNAPSVTATIDSTFAGKSIIHKFFWEEQNWKCKSKDSISITFDKRVNPINAGPDLSLYTFDNLFRMKAHKWESGKWTLVSGTGDIVNDTDTSTVIENLSKGVNTFLWTVQNGTCINEDQVVINVYELEIPEGFSPNNDKDIEGGYNNTFAVKGLDLEFQEAELKIVNGAGTEVFSTSNISGHEWEEWDGKNSKGIDLPEGTYYYLLKITSDPSKGGNGTIFKKSGFIILKRY